MSDLRTKDGLLVTINRNDIHKLFESLHKSKYDILGPVKSDFAITYDQIDSVDDLPIGWIDHQDNGKYRLVENDRPALFDYVVGQHSWKKYLHRPDRIISEINRNGKSFDVVAQNETPAKRAFLGVRPCELQALAIHDNTLLQGPYADENYQALRENLFIVAVNCTRSGNTCFCSSMNTGPRANEGFDLCLTEVLEDGKHYFVVDIGSKDGQDLLKKIPHQEASDYQAAIVDQLLEQAAQKMNRHIKTDDLKELLERNFDNLHWEKVAERCLTCGNCTLVCPTCFCVNVQDETDLTGNHAYRRRLWDSCFTVGFSYIHGGSIRNSEMSRYRQWLMHKLCYWKDQFDSFGCVGCGRCITWCPAGIDITEEVQAIRDSET